MITARIKMHKTALKIKLCNVSVETVNVSSYTGTYTAIPSREKQTFPTAGKRMAENMTVEPIPDEYADVSGTTAQENTVFAGERFVKADGVAATGNFTIDDELSEQKNIITQIKAVLEAKGATSAKGGA